MTHMGDWQALAREVVNRRVTLGYQTRQSFSQAAGLSARTVGDIERARRDSYDVATLARIEQTLKWTPGSVQNILDGGTPTPVRPELDTRLVERESDDLALMSLLAQSGLSSTDTLHVVMYIRARRAQQYDELVAEVRGLITDMGGTPPEVPHGHLAN